MSYDLDELCVNNLWMIPKHFFLPSLIEKRNPLSDKARRAGWVGCNILYDQIPNQGRISIIQDRVPIEKETVLYQVRRSAQLLTENIDARGWLLDVLQCVNQIPEDTFNLDAVYQYEPVLAAKHPKNHNIRPKIRQQLQLLRDKGFIEFVGRGLYRKTEADTQARCFNA